MSPVMTPVLCVCRRVYPAFEERMNAQPMVSLALSRVLLAITGLAGLSGLYYRLLEPVAYHVFAGKASAPSSLLTSALGAASVGLAISTMLAVTVLYVYHGFGLQADIYRSGGRTSNMVALTFDDGPSPDFTPLILDILREHGVPATFFLVGEHVRKYPEIARRIVDEGHEIGNHTYSHRNLPTLSAVALHREVIQGTKAIAEVTGVYPSYVRPPRGMYDGRFGRLAELMGQKIVLWTVSSRDWRYGTTAENITRMVLSRVKGGDIILFHDSGALVRNEGGDRSATVEALPAIINGIRERGLVIVPLGVLLAGEEPQEEVSPPDMPE